MIIYPFHKRNYLRTSMMQSEHNQNIEKQKSVEKSKKCCITLI